jgi:hypothetical protein
MRPDYRDEDFEAQYFITRRDDVFNSGALPDRIKKDQVFEDTKWRYCQKKPIIQRYFTLERDTIVETSEGEFLGYTGDRLMEDVNHNYYVCKKDVFEKTYNERGNLSGSEVLHREQEAK